MKEEWFYTITESMIERGLLGTELNLFAIIFGYSQKGDGCCYATREELAARCGVKSKRTIDTAIAGLIERGFIRKFYISKDGKKLTAYSYVPSAKIAPLKGANSAPQEVQKLPDGGANSAHKENKEENQHQKIIPPTPQEVAEYARTQGFADPTGFAAYYCAYQTENGWMTGKGKARKPIDNWKLNVIAWGRYRKNEIFSSKTTASASMNRDAFKTLFANQ